jgi:hypothetical protein
VQRRIYVVGSVDVACKMADDFRNKVIVVCASPEELSRFERGTDDTADLHEHYIAGRVELTLLDRFVRPYAVLVAAEWRLEAVWSALRRELTLLGVYLVALTSVPIDRLTSMSLLSSANLVIVRYLRGESGPHCTPVHLDAVTDLLAPLLP